MCRTVVVLNSALPYFFLFLVCFLIGIVIAFIASNINKEKKKNGFEDGAFYESEAKIDRQIYEEYMGQEDLPDNKYLKDDMEHHASKKFK